MSRRTTLSRHWCIPQHRRTPSLVGRSSYPTQTLAPFHERHRSSADEDAMTAHPNTNAVSAMTDINVLIIVGLRAASVNRELAKVAVDCSTDGIALSMFDNLAELPRYRETFENLGTPNSVG